MGIATNMPSLEEGQRAAVGAAVSDIVTYMGISAEVYYRETQSELATQVTNQLTARGAARVASGRMVEMYYEVRWQFEREESKRVYDVYVLVAIPFAELDRERRRIADETVARRALAERLLRDGMQERESGNLAGALTRWMRLLDMLEGDQTAGVTAQEARIEIARTVEDVDLRAEVPAVPVAPGAPQGLRLRAEARLRRQDGDIPLANLPLRVFFLSGTGDVDSRATTDDTGVASVVVNGMSSTRPVTLGLGVDVDRLLPQLRTATSQTTAKNVVDLRAKVVEVVLVPRSAENRSERKVVGARPGTPRPPEGSGLQRPRPSTVDGRVAMALLAGHERIYAPGDRPGTCVAFLLELDGSVDMVPSRRPLNVALVLDRSGSMKDRDKLDYLKEAAKLLVANLASRDVFSLVTYSEEIEVMSPAGTLSDPTFVQHAIEMMRAAGTTNLSGGLIEGIAQATAYHRDDMLTRVILVSDGLANTGITDPDLLARYAANTAAKGISITTIGLGSDFDEDLLLTLADEGQGYYYYARHPDEIPGILAAEMDGLATVRAQRITIDLDLEPGVKFLNSLGIPFKQTASGVQFRVGQLSAGERVRVAFQLEPPPGGPGTVRLGHVRVVYDDIHSPGTRHRREFPLVTTYTRNFRDAERSANAQVNRFVHVLALMDSMLLAQKSGDRVAIRNVLQHIEIELPKLKSWVQQRDDQEMRSLVDMLQHCLMLLREEFRSPSMARSADADVAKEISYKLYRLQHHSLWDGQQVGSSQRVTDRSAPTPRERSRRP
ncbi:MAG: VWA domain-containing protein [Acidobacteria bacterium]|nr:VWA domain-containing protein [Acidobacteriota bacterium]NIQ30667.1 VWA domain-containing protein [Acidobacteriota bacterium]NIQ85625.1 VWA domain-containing protein [Acidobacteriota bacterium]